MHLTNSVVLIGPICAGKTTLSQILGKFFNSPVIHTDSHKGPYFLKKGFNEKYSNNILKEQGLVAYYDYLKKFEYDYIVNGLVLPPHPCIYDFGAGLVCFEEVFRKTKIIKLLGKFDSALLILPHRDHEKSYQLIYNRLISRSKKDKELFNYAIDENFDLIEHSLKMFQDLSYNIKMKKIFTSYSIKHSLQSIITYLIEAELASTTIMTKQ